VIKIKIIKEENIIKRVKIKNGILKDKIGRVERDIERDWYCVELINSGTTMGVLKRDCELISGYLTIQSI